MTTTHQAFPVAERLRTAVAAIPTPSPHGEVTVTLSIGIAEALFAPPAERFCKGWRKDLGICCLWR